MAALPRHLLQHFAAALPLPRPSPLPPRRRSPALASCVPPRCSGSASSGVLAPLAASRPRSPFPSSSFSGQFPRARSGLPDASCSQTPSPPSPLALGLSRPASHYPRHHRHVAMSAASSDGGAAGGPDKLGVLFVCLGNICRSPTAEAVFRHVVEKEGLSDRFSIDSAGTIDYHEGNPADSRMRKAAANRGINITSISRPIRPSDFSDFDLILAMDKQNLADIQRAYRNWSRTMSLPPDGLSKVVLMCNYAKNFDLQEVPDPYYGGAQGFELVLDLLDDACSQLLVTLKPKILV